VAGFAAADSNPRPKSARELASSAISLALGNYRVLIGAIAVVAVPAFVVAGAALGYWRAKSPTSLNPTGSARVAELIGVAVLVLGNLLAQAVGVHAATNIAAGRAADWRRSVRVAFTRAGPVLSVSVEVAVLCGLGLLLFIVPGVFLWFTWLVVMPVVVLEQRTGREALARSSYLVRGRWWSVFGGYLLVELFVVIWAYIASIVVGVVVHGTLASQAIAEQLASVFVELALAPMIVAFVAVTYLDLRLRREGFSPANIELRSDSVPDGANEGATQAGASWRASPVSGTPPRQVPPSPPPQHTAGPWWSSESPRVTPIEHERPERPPGWPAVSPKPTPPGQGAWPRDDNRTPEGSDAPSDDAPDETDESS
jgi:uncharacterized membrane protein